MLTLLSSSRSLPSLSPEALAMLQTSLFEYFSTEFVSGNAENGVTCASPLPLTLRHATPNLC